MDVVNNTNYIFHDYPPIEILESNNHKFDKYRDWDILMNRFSSSKNKDKDENTPPSQNRKEGLSQNKKDPPSQNENHPPSQNRKVNNIIELNNNRIESSNNIINQSIKTSEKKEDKSNKDKKDRLTDIDKKIKEKGFISYEDLIYNLRLEKDFFQYPISEWIDSFRKALWEMYYYEDTKIRGRKISLYDVLYKLQDLNIYMIITTIEKVIEKSKVEKIEHPIAYLKTAIFNEIDEFSARIQAQVNYDLSDNKSKDRPNKVWKTRFHNFQQRTDKYSEEELEAIVRKKRQEFIDKHKNKIIEEINIV